MPFLSSAITFLFLAATSHSAAAWILRGEHMQRASRGEHSMRGESSEFLSQTAEHGRDRDQLIRYISDSERIVTRNIWVRSSAVSCTMTARIDIRDISC